VVKHAIVGAAKWIVAGAGAALAWIAIVTTPRSKPAEAPPQRES
jgi:hypothetical protein